MLQCVLLVAWFLLLWRFPGCSFSAAKQGPLRLLREKAGLELRTKVNNPNMTYSDEARVLLGQIADARERGDWHKVSCLFRSYSGKELPVFHAVLHAAYNCGQFREAAVIYNELHNLKITLDAAAFATGIKIFAKLEDPVRVREIWANATRSCALDELLAAARIDAAAAEGDIRTAAEVLDLMNRTGVQINIAHITSAIRACWEAPGSGHNAAEYLFNLLLERGLQPNVVMFTSLMGAYSSAPLSQVLAARAKMRTLQVQANKAFVEVYLNTLLQITKEEWKDLRSVQEMSARLAHRSPERLAAARAALADVRREHVTMTTLSDKIERAMKMVGID